jgi:hypothetical protein
MKLSAKAQAVHKAAMANKAVSAEILASISGPSIISAAFAASASTTDAAFAAVQVGDIVLVNGAAGNARGTAVAAGTGPTAPAIGDLVLVIRQ